MRYNKNNTDKYFTDDYPHLTMLIAQVGGLKASEMLGVSNIYTAIRTNRVRKTHELAAKGLIDELTNPEEPIKGRTPEFIKKANVEHNFGKKPTKAGYNKTATVNDVKAIAERLAQKYKVTQREADKAAQDAKALHDKAVQITNTHEEAKQLSVEDALNAAGEKLREKYRLDERDNTVTEEEHNKIVAELDKVRNDANNVKSVNNGVETTDTNALEQSVKNTVTTGLADQTWIVIVDTPFRNETSESLIKHIARTNNLSLVAKASCYVAFRGTRENALKFRQVIHDAGLINSVFQA